MFRKLMLTGMLGIGAIAGLAATPTTAEAAAAVRVVRTNRRVVYRNGYRHWAGYRHWGPRVIVRPVVVNRCP